MIFILNLLWHVAHIEVRMVGQMPEQSIARGVKTFSLHA